MGELELRRGKLSTDKDAAKNAEKAAKKLFDEGKDLCGKKDDAVMVAIARAYYNVDPVKYADEIEDAKKDAKKRDKQSADLYVFEGDILADKQQWGSAASWYEMVMRSGKDNIEAYVKYANTYFYVNPDVAIQTLEDLVASKPNSALAQRELAEKYYKDDQWTKAAEKYGIYMQNPNHFKQDENRYLTKQTQDQQYVRREDLRGVNLPRIRSRNQHIVRIYPGRADLYRTVGRGINRRFRPGKQLPVHHVEVQHGKNRFPFRRGHFHAQVHPFGRPAEKAQRIEQHHAHYHRKKPYVQPAYPSDVLFFHRLVGFLSSIDMRSGRFPAVKHGTKIKRYF